MSAPFPEPCTAEAIRSIFPHELDSVSVCLVIPTDHAVIFTFGVMRLALKSCRRPKMKKHPLSIPQLMFVAGTRAVLGAGVALLATRRLSDRKRRTAGLALALVGVATTIPAARIVAGASPSLMAGMAHRFGW
jgi:hypothetical protein